VSRNAQRGTLAKSQRTPAPVPISAFSGKESGASAEPPHSSIRTALLTRSTSPRNGQPHKTPRVLGREVLSGEGPRSTQTPVSCPAASLWPALRRRAHAIRLAPAPCIQSNIASFNSPGVGPKVLRSHPRGENRAFQSPRGDGEQHRQAKVKTFSENRAFQLHLSERGSSPRTALEAGSGCNCPLFQETKIATVNV
jgi:hypothetical protein